MSYLVFGGVPFKDVENVRHRARQRLEERATELGTVFHDHVQEETTEISANVWLFGNYTERNAQFQLLQQLKRFSKAQPLPLVCQEPFLVIDEAVLEEPETELDPEIAYGNHRAWLLVTLRFRIPHRRAVSAPSPLQPTDAGTQNPGEVESGEGAQQAEQIKPLDRWLDFVVEAVSPSESGGSVIVDDPGQERRPN